VHDAGGLQQFVVDLEPGASAVWSQLDVLQPELAIETFADVGQLRN
jgi:hypothetical protein